MRVKICGIRSAADAAMCVSAGADALGFLCAVPASVPCRISPAEARAIVAKVPPYVATVMVTTSSDPDEIEEIVRAVGASTLQLHGSATAASVEKLRERNPSLKLIRAIPVVNAASLDEARFWQSSVDALLLDSKGEGAKGGTGRVHDWNLSREIIQAMNIPVILAGGLGPDNVQQAVRATRPFAVDVNSGVTNAMLVKDPARVAEFILRARQA